MLAGLGSPARSLPPPHSVQNPRGRPELQTVGCFFLQVPLSGQSPQACERLDSRGGNSNHHGLFFFFSLTFIFILHIYFACMYVSVPCTCSACGGQKRALIVGPQTGVTGGRLRVTLRVPGTYLRSCELEQLVLLSDKPSLQPRRFYLL